MKAGGKGPRYAEVACVRQERGDARKTAHKYFRWSVTGWPVQAELPDTKVRGGEQARHAGGRGRKDHLRAIR